MSSNIDLLNDWFNDTIISYGNDKQLLIKKYDYFIEKWNYYLHDLDYKEQKVYMRIKKKIDKKVKLQLK